MIFDCEIEHQVFKKFIKYYNIGMNTTTSSICLFFGFKEGTKLTFMEVQELCAKIHLMKSTTKKEYDSRYYLLNKEKKRISNWKYMEKHGDFIRNKEKLRQKWNRSLCGVLGRCMDSPEWKKPRADLFV